MFASFWRGTNVQVLFLVRALYSSSIAFCQFGPLNASVYDFGNGNTVEKLIVATEVHLRRLWAIQKGSRLGISRLAMLSRDLEDFRQGDCMRCRWSLRQIKTSAEVGVSFVLQGDITIPLTEKVDSEAAVLRRLGSIFTSVYAAVHKLKKDFDFQDSPDDEEDTRSSYDYLNDLEEEYQARALLAKSKRFFKKVTQRFSSTKATNQTKCHKCGKKELRPTKDFEAKYNKFKAKLALLSSSASASKSATVKKKGLIAESYQWDEEEVSSDDNEMVEVKVLMALAEENDAVSKEGAKNVFVKSSSDDTKVSIHGVERPWLSEAEGFILPNHDTGKILPAELQRNTTDPSVAVTDSSVTKYDLADESSVCYTPLPLLKKLDGVEPISGSKTIKLILRSKSTFKAETLKGVKINEPSSAPGKGNKSSSASKVNSVPVGKLKSAKNKDDPLLAIVIKELNDLRLQISKNQSSYSINNQQRIVTRFCFVKSRKEMITEPVIMLNTFEMITEPVIILCRSYDHDTNGHNRIISLEREINPRNPQHTFKRCKVCGSSTLTTTDHYDIEWFKRGEALQAKKVEALKSTRAESSNTNRSKTPTKSQLCDAKYIVQFDEKRRTILNFNKEVLMIAPRDLA
ncbi:hypothetical protein Tco_0097273 [Tanacetum coccineum]